MPAIRALSPMSAYRVFTLAVELTRMECSIPAKVEPFGCHRSATLYGPGASIDLRQGRGREVAVTGWHQ